MEICSSGLRSYRVVEAGCLAGYVGYSPQSRPAGGFSFERLLRDSLPGCGFTLRPVSPVFRLDEGAIFAWVFRYVFDRDQYLYIRPCMYSDVNVPPLAASFLYSSLWCFELSGLQGVSLVSGRQGIQLPSWNMSEKECDAAGYRWTLDLGLWKLVRILSTKIVSWKSSDFPFLLQAWRQGG